MRNAAQKLIADGVIVAVRRGHFRLAEPGDLLPDATDRATDSSSVEHVGGEVVSFGPR